MKKMIVIILGIEYLLAQPPIIIPANKIDAEVKVEVEFDSILNMFTFNYKIKSLPTSEQYIWAFCIPLSTPSDTLQIKEVTGPIDWWDESGRVFGFGKWVPFSSIDSLYELKPGDSLSGFSIKTYLFPDTGNAYLEGDAPPPTFFEEPPENWEDSLGIKYWSLTPYGPGKVYRTVGFSEKPPLTSTLPGGHYPNEAFKHLRNKLDNCNTINWVGEHEYWELRRILEHAWNHIENGRLEQSKRTLTRFMKTIERLKEQGKITKEAFYVLWYRTKYVRDNLWYKP